MQAEGHQINAFADEPEIDIFEKVALQAIGCCSGVLDIIAFGEVHGIQDIEQFLRIVNYGKGVVKDNAPN